MNFRIQTYWGMVTVAADLDLDLSH